MGGVVSRGTNTEIGRPGGSCGQVHLSDIDLGSSGGHAEGLENGQVSTDDECEKKNLQG